MAHRFVCVGLEHGELVAAEPRNDVGPSRDAQNPFRRLLQQQIARGMPERVVDLLEMIQVEIEHRERAAAAPARRE
jgi:hypothetical protein